MDTLQVAQHARVLPDGFIAALQTRFGERCSVSESARAQQGRDESPYLGVPPDAVVYAESVDDVVWVARHCHAHRVALIPHGVGSSLEGQLLAVEGGVSLDLTRINQILAVDAEDFTATVQVGVTRKQLNAWIRDTGLCFPIDPGADASLGGMAATRASGTNAVRFGTMRENVVSLKVVTADGRVIRTAGRARKSSADHDLTRLFIGSEGTLGIIVEVIVRLYPRLEAASVAICNFPTIDDAVRSVTEVVQMGIPVSRVEFMDARAVRVTIAYSHLQLQESPVLLFEFDGSPAAVREQTELTQRITRDHHGQDFKWAEHEEDRNRLWQARRHDALFAAVRSRSGCRCSTTEVCVPISRLAECVDATA